MVVANKRMKDDEVKDIAKIKNDLEDWLKVADLLAEIKENESPVVDAATGSADVDISQLNNFTL